MAVHNGKNADVKLTSTAVTSLGDWSISTSAQFVSKLAFEDDAEVKYWTGYNWTASAAGWLDLADAGQLAWFNACISGTQQTTTRFYLDTTGYFSGNCYVTGFNPTATRGDLVKVSYTFEGDGALTFTNA